jgi:hypothetical protein
MGSPYSREITQWSDGSYPDANNAEDDLVKMAGNGAPLIADEAGSSADTALPVALPAAFTGLIADRSDVDAFTVNASGLNPLDVAVAPYFPGPDLDASITVTDLSGRVLATSSPPFDSSDVQGSVGASLSVQLPKGTYVITVDGAGNGLAGSAGESDYGSVGWYTLTASDGATAVAPEPLSPTPSPSPTATDPSPSPSPTPTDSPSPTASDSPSPSPSPTLTTKKSAGKGGGGGRNR